MYPSPQTLKVLKSSTLFEFIEALGSDMLYAYNHRVIIVLVNHEPRWPSAQLTPDDTVMILPIITGG
jgi:hypothetical protein